LAGRAATAQARLVTNESAPAATGAAAHMMDWGAHPPSAWSGAHSAAVRPASIRVPAVGRRPPTFRDGRADAAPRQSGPSTTPHGRGTAKAWRAHRWSRLSAAPFRIRRACPSGAKACSAAATTRCVVREAEAARSIACAVPQT